MGKNMEKKHPVRLTILTIIFVIVVAFGINQLISMAAEDRRSRNMNEQLSLGIRCLTELDYEAAVVYFDQVLAVDDKNVAAYVGTAIAYSQMGDREMAAQKLTDGLRATDSGVLTAMLDDLDAGRNLGQYYSMVEAQEKLTVAENPFDTLELLGSSYYQWDFSTCAELLGFDYEEYAGQSVSLGAYAGMNIYFDATSENVGFAMVGEDYTYGYWMLSGSQLQLFGIDCTKDAENLPSLNEIVCRMEMGRSYEEVLSASGLPQMEDNVFYVYDSNLGQVGCIRYEEDGETKLYLYSSDRRLLGLELSFKGDELAGAEYSCGVPDNLRSRAIGWVNSLIH